MIIVFIWRLQLLILY